MLVQTRALLIFSSPINPEAVNLHFPVAAFFGAKAIVERINDPKVKIVEQIECSNPEEVMQF